MKVLLINAPVSVVNEHARLTLPLGLAYIASALEEAGHQVSAVDFNVSGQDLGRLEGILLYERPDMVGVSAMTETYRNGLAIAAAVKAFDPGTATVFGGAHPTIRPEDVLAEDAVDYVVVGAGERGIVALAAYLEDSADSLAEIPGLGYTDGTGVHVNARGELPHPDELPWPARELFPIDFYKEKYTLLTATGACPYKCPFCSGAHLWQGKRKARSAGSIIAELDMLVADYGASEIFFSDDIFTLNRPWVMRLVEALLERPYRIRWGCATRVDLVDAELLAAMAKAGCVGIQFGVESGSRSILDAVKGITREQVLAAVTGAVAVDIETVCSFMVPFPDDTPETLRDTREFMLRVQEAGGSIMLNYTCPHPGTYFNEHAAELGLKILTANWDDYSAKKLVLETRNLGRAEIEAAVAGMADSLGLTRSVS